MSSMSRRIHGAFLGLDKTLAQHMKHSPIDDIESSIWVLILVLYQIGTKLESAPNITSDQREAKNALMSTDSDKSRLAKRSAASSPGGVFPQWLALDSFIHRILGLCTPTIKEEVVSEDEALVVYEEYFKGVLDCLQSQDPILTADWNHVFSQPLHTPPRAQVEAKRAHRPAPLSDLATLMESAPDAST
ncbi:hypothetical protein DL93DRAFT_1868175 [Clavulina sp. PMI_390]|nr:hypothetical protein DL93DRAFT_1868175 [Clavulina sp. PMI_390]